MTIYWMSGPEQLVSMFDLRVFIKSLSKWEAWGSRGGTSWKKDVLRGLCDGDAEHSSHRRSEEAHLSMVPWSWDGNLRKEWDSRPSGPKRGKEYEGTDRNKAEEVQMKESGQYTHGAPFPAYIGGNSHVRPSVLLSHYNTDSYLGFQIFACSCAFVEDNIGLLSVLPWQCWCPKPVLPTLWLWILVFVYLSSILSLKTSDCTVGDPDDPWFQDCHKKGKSSSNFRQWTSAGHFM